MWAAHQREIALAVRWVRFRERVCVGLESDGSGGVAQRSGSVRVLTSLYKYKAWPCTMNSCSMAATSASHVMGSASVHGTEAKPVANGTVSESMMHGERV